MTANQKDIRVSFPGGKRVDAHYGDRVVQTDQSAKNGGEGSAPEPFDLFFVSMATCVGIYVLEFCTARNLDTTGLGVRLISGKNPDRKHYDQIHIEITLPEDFPAKYRPAILRTADLCAVKKHILEPPEFKITLTDVELQGDCAMEIEIKKILCPVDFSDPGRYAFDYACAVARRHGASLELLHVTEASAYAEDEMPSGQISCEESLQQQLRQWALAADCPAETRLIAGIPYIEIIQRAEELQADMIVIGTHGRTGLKHMLIGSVAERVVRTASCPVLTVRHPDFKSAEK